MERADVQPTIVGFEIYLACNSLIWEHCGGVVVGTSVPSQQVALLPPFLTRSATHVRVITTPFSTGKVGSVMTLRHPGSPVHFRAEIMMRYVGPMNLEV